MQAEPQTEPRAYQPLKVPPIKTTENPGTVTEAFLSLMRQEEQIKDALDRLIRDATELRARL